MNFNSFDSQKLDHVLKGHCLEIYNIILINLGSLFIQQELDCIIFHRKGSKRDIRPKMKILSSFTDPHVILNLWNI